MGSYKCGCYDGYECSGKFSLSLAIYLVIDPTVYLDDDCTSCSDADECDAAIVAQSCYNRVNCGDPGIMLGILNTSLVIQ